MEVKLTETMKKEIERQAIDQAVRLVLAEFDAKQVAAEVKNAVIKQAAKEVSQKFDEAYRTNEVVERAVQSAESRVQTKVTALLEKGITISFKNE